MRIVVNLGDLNASRLVNQTGSSGHPFDAHYVDQTDAWVKNETYPWPFSEKAVRDGGGDELILSPRLVRQLTRASQSWRSRRLG